MNLALWRYRNIVGGQGPIESVLTQRLQFSSGETYFESYSFLKSDLIAKCIIPSVLYGNSSGTGTSNIRLVSVFKSISESLERWAYFHYLKDNQSRAGIHLDRTTNGFSAFPGVTAIRARDASLYEAVERWALINWWKGQVSLRKTPLVVPRPSCSIDSYQIIANHQSHVSLLAATIPGPGNRLVHAYGFAADKNMRKGQERAMIELERNIRVLDSLSDHQEVREINSLQDARLLFFSQNEGHALFQDRVNSSLSMRTMTLSPRLIFDSEIRGPWSKYASVWRCIFETPNVEERVDEFFF